MTRILNVLKADGAAAKRKLAALRGRVEEQERRTAADPKYRRRVKAVFGKPLAPRQVVERILEEVRRRGDAALLEYVRGFDGAKLKASELRVSAAERRSAFRRTPRKLRRALAQAAERIFDYQKRLLPKDVPLRPARVGGAPGLRCGLSRHPLRRVGIYVPGGTAAYPSSVLMNVIPAQAAGVAEIAVVSPCDAAGRLGDAVLCACEIVGVGELYRLGGAPAVAALAFGTRTVAAVDKIAGPGNLFVTLAKQAVFGRVDIDMPAGPSELLILSDGKSGARPAWLAADLLAQAEHDPLAASILLTTSRREAEAVADELGEQLQDLPRRETAAAALRNRGLLAWAPKIEPLKKLAGDLAPEHLEVLTRDPEKTARDIHTAGALFLGPYAAESLGDYLAGPSHTLPTGGAARAFSGVSVHTFLRRSSVTACNAAGLRALSAATQVIAEAEGLEAHRRAVAVREESAS